MMRKTVAAAAAALCLALGAPSPARSASAPHCSAPTFRQFDFWLGTWRVSSPAGRPLGTNTITRELGGCVLQEHWQGSRGGRGYSFNIYDAERRQWHQSWVDNGGGLLLLDGGLADGRMILRGTLRSAGHDQRHEIAWTPNRDGSVRQLWRVSENGGTSWKTSFEGIYRRAGGDVAAR